MPQNTCALEAQQRVGRRSTKTTPPGLHVDAQRPGRIWARSPARLALMQQEILGTRASPSTAPTCRCSGLSVGRACSCTSPGTDSRKVGNAHVNHFTCRPHLEHAPPRSPCRRHRRALPSRAPRTDSGRHKSKLSHPLPDHFARTPRCGRTEASLRQARADASSRRLLRGARLGCGRPERNWADFERQPL